MSEPLTDDEQKLLAEYSSSGLTISLEKIRAVAIAKGVDPEAAVKTATEGLAKQFPDRIYQVQKWCGVCQIREEAIMYAGSRGTLEQFLDDQTRSHGHRHKVRREVKKMPGGIITDFHRVPY